MVPYREDKVTLQSYAQIKFFFEFSENSSRYASLWFIAAAVNNTCDSAPRFNGDKDIG
jgi:hypothetical protein